MTSLQLGREKNIQWLLHAAQCLKMFLMGFPFHPVSAKEKGMKGREREQDVEQSEKNPKNPFILSDHWLSARINRNWTSRERERERASDSCWRQKFPLNLEHEDYMFDEVLARKGWERVSLKASGMALTTFLLSHSLPRTFFFSCAMIVWTSRAHVKLSSDFAIAHICWRH